MENENNVQVEETTPTPETNEPDNDTVVDETAEPETETLAEPETEDNTDEPAESADSPYLSVRYNHADREMTKDEAVQYAQKGLMYDKVNPLINKLEYLAAVNEQNIADFVEGLMSKSDEEYRKGLIETYGEDDEHIEDLMKVYHDRQKSKYEKVIEDRKKADEAAEIAEKESLESRLASEFSELKAEFPDLTEFKELPAAVKKAAADGKNLTTAYLLYKHNEDKKIKAAEIKQKEAAKQSTGSQANNPIDESSSLTKAFSDGVRG